MGGLGFEAFVISAEQRSAGLEETCGFLPASRFSPPLPTRLTVYGPPTRTITQLQKIFPLYPQQLRKSKPPKPLHPHRILVSGNPNDNRKATPRQPQANAKKSTGPNTPEGKARSSKNALKHGLLARDAVLPGEDPADFDRQLTALEDWALPRNPTGARNLSPNRRRPMAHATPFPASRRPSSPPTSTTSSAGTGRRAPRHIEPGREGDNKLLGRAMLIGGTQSLVQLSRYDAHLTRRFYRSVKLLTEIRRDQRKAREALNKKRRRRLRRLQHRRPNRPSTSLRPREIPNPNRNKPSRERNDKPSRPEPSRERK